jgi:tRNA-dihydrouridine synthase B
MFQIAGLSLKSPFILAPLAGYSDLPFRLLCREYGAGLVVSEMISCHGLLYRQAKTLKMLESSPAEQPVSFQLFGADPELMGEAAAILNDFSPSLIDINMGCPVRKVTKRGAGSALMKDIQLAEQIISAVIKKSKVPVTVKTRIGIDQQTMTAMQFTRMCEGAGVSALTIHGRTWSQGFSGNADWEVIRQIKALAGIPIIGNGDIGSYTQGITRMEESRCDGIMVGRGALGNPWVFSPQGRPQSLPEILMGVNRHLELMEQYLETNRVLAYIKNQIGRYFCHFAGSSRIRQSVHDCGTFLILKDFISSLSIENG